MRIRVISVLVIVTAWFAWIAPTLAGESGSDSKLLYALIVTRHGVRSPLASQTKPLEPYAAEPWPQWNVPPGYLTPHGKQQMTLMGEYYRARFIHEGLLSGDPTADARHVYFRSDSDERTIETARGLAAAILPGIAIDPHARPNEKLDPLFRPAQVPVGPLDRDLGVASVLGRIGGDADAIVQSNAAVFHTLEQVLVGEAGQVPANKTALASLPNAVGRGAGDHTVNIAGALQVAEAAVDVLLLEYGEGMPANKVGWGRLTPERLTQLLTLHSLYFELGQGSSYPAMAQGSNLASHILASLEQAATGHADAAAFGTPQQKLVIVTGHDTNIANLGGLFGLTWWLPETPRNPLLPGGALVFELRERRRDHQRIVCLSYVAQTFAQMRELTKLTPENPPVVAPIFIPGASETTDHFGAPLSRFVELAHRVINPAFVVPDPN